MKEETLIHIAKCIAQCSSAAVRLYQNDELMFQESVYHFSCDPAEPYLNEILANEMDASIFITVFGQFCGCVRMKPDYALVIGPSRLKNDDRTELNKLMIDQDIPISEQNEYIQLLECAPDIGLERMRWTIMLYASSLNGKVYAEDDVQISSYSSDRDLMIEQFIENDADENILESIKEPDSSYEIERLITMYVEKGQIDKLRKLFGAMPKATAGKMASDAIRQLKNMNICAATVFSRAAIRGGMDSKAAFHLSDIYIQQLEMMNDAVALERASRDLVLDFASRVNKL